MNEREEFIRIMKNMQAARLFKGLGWGVRLAVIVVVALIFFGNFIFYVAPNETAIKQVNIGANTGIQTKTYQPGFHIIAPFGIHRMYRFPKDILAYEMNDYLERKAKTIQFNAEFSKSLLSREEAIPRDKTTSVQQAAHIQTSDGFFVDMDVSILYHIADPYKVITTVGPGELYETNGIVPKVEPKLKEALGVMTTEEFFKSPLRVAKALEAKELLNRELVDKGIMVDHVLIRYFKYSDEIQRNIEEKKLKDQLVFTNQSQAKASMEEAFVKKVREEGEAKLRVRMQEGQAYVTKKNAEKDQYVRTKRAEADLLIRLAEAKRTELVNNAYQRPGSDKMVGLKMADVLKGLNVIMLPSSGPQGFNPLNITKDLELFGVKEKGGM